MHAERLTTLGIGLTLVGGVVLVLSGFGGWLASGHVGGWTLVAHMAGAPLMLIGLPLFAVAGRPAGGGRARDAHDRSGLTGRAVAFWATVAFGLLTIAPIVLAMGPIFGHATQQTLYNLHRWGAAGFTVAFAAVVFLALSRKR